MILGTNATIKSKKYEKLLRLHGYNNIQSIAPSLFVPLVEEGLFDGKVLQTVIEHYFKGVKTPDAIILGCTHFPLIAKPISDYFKGSTLIHSGDAVVEYLTHEYNLTKKFTNTNITFFASENPAGLKEVAKNWLDLS